MATVMQPSATLPRDRIFFTGMALLCALIVLVGFAPTFYLRPEALGPLPTLLVVHGIFFTTWILLLVTQTSLIAANRRDIHRKLGVVGACVAAVMVGLGLTAAITSLRLGHAPVPGLDPRSFFAIPMQAMVTFSILIGSAIAQRRNAEAHKRLIILGTINILGAALARWPVLGAYGPPAFFGVTDLLMLGCVAYDWRVRGAVHRVYKIAVPLLILSQPLALGLSMSPPWLAFASWLKG
jgi:hypothetical protein